MADVYGFDQDTALRLKAMASQPRKLDSQPPYRRRQPTGGGGGGRYFKLAEDHLPGRAWIWARSCNRGGAIGSPPPLPEQVYFMGSLLAGAREGYQVLAVLVEGSWEMAQGNGCIVTTCGVNNGSSINPGNPPQATVGTAYSHSVTTSGLSGAIVATELPPGISFSGTAFSGTPTTAGDYFAKLVGPRTVSGNSCAVTRLVRITVVEPE
jgi:hypothetical protein